MATWIPEGGAVAGANCNLEVSEVEATREEWLEAFNAANPAMVGAQLREQGVDWRQGYLTEVITMHDRPAMRNLWAGAYENQGFEAMQVTISGRSNLVLIRCTIQTGYLLPALDAFYQRFDPQHFLMEGILQHADHGPATVFDRREYLTANEVAEAD